MPGDDSPLSDPVTVTTDEELPGEVSQLTLIAQTASQLKVGWEKPGNACGPVKSYHVFVGEWLIMFARRHGVLVGHTLPSTLYLQLFITAVTSSLIIYVFI